MNCPRCASPLVKKYYKGIMEVEICPLCRGMWLDFDELDRLEDFAFDQDDKKGSLVHRQADTEYPCPHCGEALHEFQYRLYSLKLDFCAAHHHGFWLEAGEEERVLEIMRQRAGEIQRKTSAESEWRGILKNLHNFFQQGK